MKKAMFVAAFALLSAMVSAKESFAQTVIGAGTPTPVLQVQVQNGQVVSISIAPSQLPILEQCLAQILSPVVCQRWARKVQAGRQPHLDFYLPIH